MPQNPNAPPDLTILDLIMPIMGSMEVCYQVRETKKAESIPILVQTAMHDNEERLKAFAAGARPNQLMHLNW